MRGVEREWSGRSGSLAEYGMPLWFQLWSQRPQYNDSIVAPAFTTVSLRTNAADLHRGQSGLTIGHEYRSVAGSLLPKVAHEAGMNVV